MSAPLDLTFNLIAAEIGCEPKQYELYATDAQLAALVDRFGLVAFNSLRADVTIHSRGNDQGIMLNGHVKADLVQSCIATLEDVPEIVDSPFSLLLVDPETADRMDADEGYLDEDQPEYDALEGDVVEVGEIIAQTVAISMNPYPRKEGVELTVGNKKDISINEPELEKENPFSVLGKIKDES